MTTGIGLSEIILILALMVIFVDSKQIPALIRKAFKIVAQIKAKVKEIMDEVNL